MTIMPSVGRYGILAGFQDIAARNLFILFISRCQCGRNKFFPPSLHPVRIHDRKVLWMVRTYQDIRIPLRPSQGPGNPSCYSKPTSWTLTDPAPSSESEISQRVRNRKSPRVAQLRGSNGLLTEEHGFPRCGQRGGKAVDEWLTGNRLASSSSTVSSYCLQQTQTRSLGYCHGSWRSA